MAIPGTTSALIAAFVFGIVVNAASAALFLNVKGHGSSVFRDGKRLVLVIFLLSSALWAQIDFITTLIDPTATASCQIGVIFTTMFDQAARYSIEQHLLWVIGQGTTAEAFHWVNQIVLAGRLILGGVFVGLTRFEFNTVCVPLSSVAVVAVITVVVDVVVLVGLFSQAISTGILSKMGDGGNSSSRGKAVVAVLVGLALWMGTSVPMILGAAGSDYFLRSTIPAGSLAILIIIVTASSSSLIAPDLKSDRERRMPEAPSPRMITTARSLTTADSNEYPPSRYEDLKAEQINSSAAFVRPREVPPPPSQTKGFQQAHGQNIPTITNASAGQGVGGLPVQGALFPPMRAESERPQPAAPRQAPQQQKKAFCDSSKGPASSVTHGGKIAISAPVLQQGGSNPLDKVATTDLATAAQMDKQKREMLMSRSDALVTAETAVEPKQGLERSTTTIRKAIAAAVSEEFRPDSETLATASSTGAQLSPSNDELRRRSPRRSTSDNVETISTRSLTQTSPPLPPNSPGRVVPQQASAPGPDPIIRPSRQRPASPEPVIEPLKTPLQRRPTNGLPMNPRSKSIRRPTPPNAGESRAQTVLFVNDIVYDDPSFVAGVMDDAKDRRQSKLPPVPAMKMREIEAQDVPSLVPPLTPLPEPPLTASSIVHRARPVPRRSNNGDGDAFYPLTGHKKSRSLENPMQRNTILASNPGSPSMLPPLPPPPPPQPAAMFQRPHPNDTKSMTYSEKVSFLFPGLSRAPDRSNRRSSVPEVLPSSFMNDSPTLADSEVREARDWESKPTTSSVRTRSIFGSQGQDEQSVESMATCQGMTKESEGQQQETVEESIVPQGNKRASSPILPIFGDFRSATSAEFEDDMTNIDFVYSPQHGQQIGLTVHQARAIDLTRGEQTSIDTRAMSAVTSGEEMTIMLDTSVAREIQQVQAQKGPSSPADDSSPVESISSTRSSGPWHRRVGGETLSFSGHSDKRRSKRGPPPTPLALSDRPTQAKQVAIAKAAEPSPLPSPEEALQMIQAQLRKYEQLDRASAESPGRQALLNDLEAEMGQQESRWLGMQNRFTQDSMTTLDMSPTAESRRASAAVVDSSSDQQNLSRNSSTHSNMSMYRRTRQASFAGSIMSITNDGEGFPFSGRASLWQHRLAAAHEEFTHAAGELQRKGNLNFLESNLGSPTPPHSDESETEIESRRNLEDILVRRAGEEAEKKKVAAKSLWTAPQRDVEISGPMWVRPEKPYHVPAVEPPLPGLLIRPAQRKVDSPLSVDSDRLWQKPASDAAPRPSKLWIDSTVVEEPEEIPIAAPAPEARNYHNPGIRRSQTISGRALTQRPPRRSRRITALPDIVEDPVPLPDKRDTLGIFQFPWGEKSDIPSIPQRTPMYRTMPGTMSTGGVRINPALDARSRQLEEQEYSSSFFDEYEDNDADSDSMGSENDDGFDETTLFEIATLLKTNNVPSTSSFFGPLRDSGDSLVDQYMSDEQRDECAQLAMEEETEGLQMMPASPLPPSQPLPSLWEDNSFDEEEERGAHGKGLPQPQDWHRYNEATETVRAKPRASQMPASIESDSLWLPEPLKHVSASRSPMWTPPDSLTKTGSSKKEIVLLKASSSLPLWQAQQQAQRGEHGVGLPHPQDWTAYASAPSTARAKPRQSEPAVIESIDLWAASESELPSLPTTMWAPKAKSAPVSRAMSSQRRQAIETSRLLWSAPSSPKEITEEGGLFSARSGRTVFRTTAQTPAAGQIGRKAQPSAVKQVETLSSTTLWTSAPTRMAERNWISTEASTMASPAPKQLLWSAPASPKDSVASGLFDIKASRSDFRTTSQPPAAAGVHRASCSPERKALDRLTSTALWSLATQVAVTEKNWIASKAVASPEMTLWSVAPATPKDVAKLGLFNSGSSRTVFRTTSQSPAAVGMTRKACLDEEKPLERLTSTALWAPVATVSSDRNWIAFKTVSAPKPSTSLKAVSSPKSIPSSKAASTPMWSAPDSPRDIDQPGLFAKSSRTVFKTTAAAPAALETIRKARSESKPLDRLDSTAMWAAVPQSMTDKHWLAVKLPSPKQELWSAPASPIEHAGTGLFAKSARTVFKTTSQSPAAIELSRKPRIAEKQALPRLASSSLWASVAQAGSEKEWISIKAAPQGLSQRLLWSAPASPIEAAAPGLYAKSARNVFKTTSQAPAALELSRKPRPIQDDSLPQLASTSLWTAVPQTASERNWISVEVVPWRLPLRRLWSAPATSIESAAPGLYAKSNRTVFKTTSQTPAAIELTNRKTRSVEEQALAQLASTSLWAPAEKSVSERNWIASASNSGTSTPSVSRVREVTPAMWQKALNDAVAASYPSSSSSSRGVSPATLEQWQEAPSQAVAASYPVRRTATAEQWQEALNEAVTASYPVRQTAARKAPIKATPADWAAALAEAVSQRYTHNTVPATTTTVSEEIEQAPGRAPSVRGRRNTAMASMFETGGAQNPPLGRSFSISRGSSISRSSSVERTLTPRPEPQVEETQPVDEPRMDAALLAQIEALEQERIFAEQWAAGSSASAEQEIEPAKVLDPSPEIVSSRASTAVQLAQELFTPSESPAPIFLEAKTYERPKRPEKKTLLSSDELGEQLFTPKDVSPPTPLEPLAVEPKDVTPLIPLAPLAVEPKDVSPASPLAPLDVTTKAPAQMTPPKATGGWLSSLSTRLGVKIPLTTARATPEAQVPEVPQIAQLQRSESVTSAGSAVSHADTITLRDSMISVDAEKGKQAAGSKIQLR